MGVTTKLTKIGNSTGVTITKEVLDAAHMARGEEVTINVVEGQAVTVDPRVEARG